MSFSSESPPEPIRNIVADSTRRGTSPAIGSAPETQAGLDLIDEYLQRTLTCRDDFLYSMNLKLFALKSQRNLHAPIHKLPVELLVYIFRLSLPAPETGPHYTQILGDSRHRHAANGRRPLAPLRTSTKIASPSLSVPSGTAGSEPNSRAFDIFNGSADQLEEVKVAWTCVPWDSPILRGLKSLHLQYCTPIRVSDVITILDDCPDLVTLIFDDIGITVDMQADPSKAVNMTRLQTIDFIVGELEGVEEVIKGFNAPNCKTFKFWFKRVEPADTEHFVLTTLAPYFPFFRRMMFEQPYRHIRPRHLSHTVMAFLRQVLGEGESCRHDVRLIIGRDWRTEGLYILDEVPSYCNVVDSWLGAYAVLRDFGTETTLWSLAEPAVLPNLQHLIISGDGWDGEETKAILPKRYNQANRNALPLRIHFIGRGVNADFNFLLGLKSIPMIEEALWSEGLNS
ncbi:hypothetical protein M407DRAFT_22193 [Tulasnella calospora MUT 4182]|uniref:F-box domain-containing protein n=1 Tax=Tulasnella calospora MUT 4182 TaxID=1051891 RepID=A0A0C3M4J5_9AGAM|nr:hypothetical protein M407DRAFT_22193 [Tulasnella calospora MUT 4182]